MKRERRAAGQGSDRPAETLGERIILDHRSAEHAAFGEAIGAALRMARFSLNAARDVMVDASRFAAAATQQGPAITQADLLVLADRADVLAGLARTLEDFERKYAECVMPGDRRASHEGSLRTQ